MVQPPQPVHNQWIWGSTLTTVQVHDTSVGLEKPLRPTDIGVEPSVQDGEIGASKTDQIHDKAGLIARLYMYTYFMVRCSSRHTGAQKIVYFVLLDAVKQAIEAYGR
jgi:hypothetical protein